jgi:hypothetical protein
MRKKELIADRVSFSKPSLCLKRGVLAQQFGELFALSTTAVPGKAVMPGLGADVGSYYG